jgi:uncharacterized MAPEG superfamily protein
MTIASVRYRKAQFGNSDNNQPREQSAALTGAGARIWAAHQNALEARVIFASAVVVAHLAGADPQLSIIASLLFVACRLLHPIFYVADRATLRSASFAIGMVSCLWLFGLEASA